MGRSRHSRRLPDRELTLATAGIVVAIGLAACLVPTLKGVSIPPTEALRVDG